jgi:hypothetical protein
LCAGQIRLTWSVIRYSEMKAWPQEPASISVSFVE